MEHTTSNNHNVQPGDYAVGLDLGTTKIVAIIGRYNERGKLEILGHGKARSQGIHRGVVNNILKTVNSIKHAVEQAESVSDVKVANVVAGIAGQHIRSLQHSDYITRDEADAEINEEDIRMLTNNVEKLNMLPGEKIIHVLPQEYRIDGQAEIKEPIGMCGARLEANFHIVVGQVASIRNISRCIENAGLQDSTITLEPLASAEAVLSQEEKEAGVVLVDIGGGTTDVAIFKDNIIRHTAVIPFGGNVITNDIKEGCSIIEKQAEQLKVRFGSAWPGENKENEIVSIPGIRGREGKEISLKRLSQIIHSRVVEIIEQVYMEIKNYGHTEPTKKLIAGIVLTGGGAQLKHIRQLVEYVTGMDTRIGFSDENLASGAPEELSTPMFATGIGLLMEGLRLNIPQLKLDVEVEEKSEIEDVHIADAEQISQEEQIKQEEEHTQKSRAKYMDKFLNSIRRFMNDDVN